MAARVAGRERGRSRRHAGMRAAPGSRRPGAKNILEYIKVDKSLGRGGISFI